MIIALAAVILVAGAFVAVLAPRFPNNEYALYRWGGCLLLAGVVLLGLAFPIMI